MDIKAKINEVVEKVTSDKTMKEKFEKNPVKAIEDILGVDLPDDAMDKIVDGVKAKVAVDSISDVASKFKKLF
ncbi:MAG: hypothetical protein IKL22_10975 [Lachnospiraceae bacterium]|nr:hypothetical protein [Lachnospiraceae bacterium]